MKSLLLASVLVALLVNIAYAKPPPQGPSLSDLTGVWVEEGCVRALHERYLPPPAYYQLMIEPSEDGKTFKLYYNNATEGIGYQLLALERTERAGEYVFRMGMELPREDGDSPSGRPFRVRVLLNLDDKGHVAHIKLLDNRFNLGIPQDPFVRIPVRFPARWKQYINRVLFAGKWKDERGAIFSFDESGEGHRPDGVSFTYQMPLGGPIVSISLRASPDTYRFTRIGDELRFYRREPFSDGPGYEASPFLVLKKEEEK